MLKTSKTKQARQPRSLLQKWLRLALFAAIIVTPGLGQSLDCLCGGSQYLTGNCGYSGATTYLIADDYVYSSPYSYCPGSICDGQLTRTVCSVFTR